MKEKWKPVVGFEGYYEVSDQGRVRSVDRFIVAKNRWGVMSARKYKGRLLKPYENVDRGGYLYVNLQVEGQQRMSRVHCLVAKAFIGHRPEGCFVLHKNAKRKDNRATNLKYGTPTENGADMVAHGNSMRGEKSYNNVLTHAQVIVIRRNRGYVSQRVLAKCFNVSQQHICNIQRGARWAHV